jgi:hypothetical protein
MTWNMHRDMHRDMHLEETRNGLVKWAFPLTDDSWVLMGPDLIFGISLDEPPFKGVPVKPAVNPEQGEPGELDF